MSFHDLAKSTVSLFGAFPIVPELVEDSGYGIAESDLVALALDFKYALAPDLLKAIQALAPGQRGTAFLVLGESLTGLVKGLGGQVSALYRSFPNHEVMPGTLAFYYWFLEQSGIDTDDNFDPRLYGANPITGFQSDALGSNQVLDAAFTVRIVSDKGGNSRRKLRFLKLADREFLRGKAIALMNNLTPFSETESGFVKTMIATGLVNAADFSDLRFREKLPLIADQLSVEDYAAMSRSVTDALRLAVHLSGPQSIKSTVRWGATTVLAPDLSLKRRPRFHLSKSQAKRVMAILDAIVSRGTTDVGTDMRRHSEYWKRFGAHIRSKQFERQYPHAALTLADLREGKLRSWESDFAASDAEHQVKLAAARPGVFMRRIAALYRAVKANGSNHAMLALHAAAEEVFPKVGVPLLLQAWVHVTRSVGREDRFHQLPSGKLMHSVRPQEDMPEISRMLAEHLETRLRGTFPFAKSSPEAARIFLPAGNRAMSETDTRTARGDRVTLAFTNEDTVRLFLHWKAHTDVDLSVSFYDQNLNGRGVCSYYSLKRGDFSIHSGDILSAPAGAAEYVDVNVKKALKASVRYALMTVNVFSGQAFADFPCHAGVMIRDGRTGKHFEIETVETKLRLASRSRCTIIGVFDFHRGEFIYTDLPASWNARDNVEIRGGEIGQAMQYFLDYEAYRPSLADVLTFAGSDATDAPQATAAELRDGIDEILATLATK